MIAKPANYPKFFLISNEQTTGKFCCAALDDGCISVMDKTGVSHSTSAHGSQ